MNTQTLNGPGVGPYFTNMTCVVYNRISGATLALGDVVMLDHLGTGAATYSDVALPPNTDVGNSISPTKCWPLGNAINPATTGMGSDVGDPGAIFGVVSSLMQGAGAENTKVEITIAGVVSAKFPASVTFGDDLYPANGVRTLTATAPGGGAGGGTRCLAKALYTGAGPGLVLFNGIGSPGGQTGDFTTA